MGLAFICRDEQKRIVAVFNSPQFEPFPEGYEVTTQDDPGIAQHFAEMEKMQEEPVMSVEAIAAQMQFLQKQLAKHQGGGDAD